MTALRRAAALLLILVLVSILTPVSAVVKDPIPAGFPGSWYTADLEKGAEWRLEITLDGDAVLTGIWSETDTLTFTGKCFVKNGTTLLRFPGLDGEEMTVRHNPQTDVLTFAGVRWHRQSAAGSMPLTILPDSQTVKGGDPHGLFALSFQVQNHTVKDIESIRFYYYCIDETGAMSPEGGGSVWVVKQKQLIPAGETAAVKPMTFKGMEAPYEMDIAVASVTYTDGTTEDIFDNDLQFIWWAFE